MRIGKQCREPGTSPQWDQWRPPIVRATSPIGNGGNLTSNAYVINGTAGTMAQVKAGETVNLVMYPPRRSLLDFVMRRPQDDMLESKLAQAFGRMPFHAWMKGGFLRMMPYWVEVK